MAAAAGFDNPTLYTARHQGMAGAAISYVDDPSAAFHNPAGLQGVHGLAFLGDVSLLFAHVTGSPAASASASGIQSELVVAPYFLAASAYRVQPWLSVGVGVFPVASGGGEYEYPVPGNDVNQYDATTIVLYELTPLLSLNLPKNSVVPGELSAGIGYRLTLSTFERKLGQRDDPRGLNLDLSGHDLMGFRAGLQYRPTNYFSVGVVYRNKVTLTNRADEAIVLGQSATDVELPLVSPAQLGAGIRSDIQRFGMAFDASYTFQEQNERSALSARLNGVPAAVPSVFEWQNAFTLRFGIEYRLGPSQEVPLRLGYVFDDQVTNRAFPSAFGTPPTPTRSLTMGGGYVADSWEVNLALALRSGGTTINPTELAPAGACPTCGYSGEYAISTTGLYVDVSTELDL